MTAYVLSVVRDFVDQVMYEIDPDGPSRRDPTKRRVRRSQLTSLGPHEEWSCDGHDKLVKYGFGLWGARDKWSGKWLGLWDIPNNRSQQVIAYLWLSILRDLGGKSDTDAGY